MQEFERESGLDLDGLNNSTVTALVNWILYIPVLGRGIIFFYKTMSCVMRMMSRKYLRIKKSKISAVFSSPATFVKQSY